MKFGGFAFTWLISIPAVLAGCATTEYLKGNKCVACPSGMPCEDKAIGATTTASPRRLLQVASNITTANASASNITNATNTTTTAFAGVINQVVLILKGNFNEVIGEGKENKQKFLAACTLKLSKNKESSTGSQESPGSDRDLRCVDVRPGSIIVDIEGPPKTLKELAEELKTKKSFVLEGYAELTIDKVDISRITTTESPPEEMDEEPQFIKYLMANVGVLVGIIIAAVLLLVIIGMSIFICYKFCTCNSGMCCQVCQEDDGKKSKEEKKELMSIVTQSLVESTPRTSLRYASKLSNPNNVAISNPVISVTDGSKTSKATTMVLSNPHIAVSGAS